MTDLIPKHGGYRNLKSFQIAQLIYDITVRFCDRYIERFSRTRDQMVQAARSGVQNIAEGSEVSATSKKLELKLTQVARASLEELRLDYEDFLRQRKLVLWEREEPLRQELINARCRTADEVAKWIVNVKKRYGRNGCDKRDERIKALTTSMQSMQRHSLNAEISANAVLVLIVVACSLLDRQVSRLAQDFEKEGGFTERLYKIRSSKRKEQSR